MNLWRIKGGHRITSRHPVRLFEEGPAGPNWRISHNTGRSIRSDDPGLDDEYTALCCRSSTRIFHIFAETGPMLNFASYKINVQKAFAGMATESKSFLRAGGAAAGLQGRPAEVM